MKKITALWDWLGARPFIFRFLIKLLILAIVFLVIAFPNPVLNIKQIEAYTNTEALFETGFPEMATINVAIDSLLPPNYTFDEEAKTIVRFVYDKIKYQFDWDNWGNSEYWPSAGLTWRRGREDCDGRAILAVAIFRSRGYQDAEIVGSMSHLWIKVAGKELMGPDKEKVMVVENGRKKMRLPSLAYMLEATATQFYYYPIFRMMVILLTLLLLLYHPAKNLKLLLALALATVIGFVLVLDWSSYVSFYEKTTVNTSLVVGSSMLVVAMLMALYARKLTTKSRAYRA